MKNLSFILFVVSLLCFSCSSDETTREEESAKLEKMYNEIVAYSQINSKTCTNPEEWAFTKFGNSNCSSYILYNKQIDAAVFQKKVDEYIVAKGKFNVKWGVLSDCMPMQVPALIPSQIECKDGKPVIKYGLPEN
ncbi:hypothetical protein [Flavobacterium sp. HJSW_4]|uniref:hypothetical protein n=1 Tax=Flavobacterium sp. HJSW_4 TaxID=3344660 RepID=UPI0035F45C86